MKRNSPSTQGTGNRPIDNLFLRNAVRIQGRYISSWTPRVIWSLRYIWKRSCSGISRSLCETAAASAQFRKVSSCAGALARIEATRVPDSTLGLPAVARSALTALPSASPPRLRDCILIWVRSACVPQLSSTRYHSPASTTDAFRPCRWNNTAEARHGRR